VYVSCTVSEIFSVKERRDLEICVRGRSRSFIMVSSESLGIFYSYSIVTMALCCSTFEIQSDLTEN